MNNKVILVLVTLLTPLFAAASDSVPSEIDWCASKSMSGIDVSIQNFIAPACDSGLSMRKAVAAELEAAAQQKNGDVGAVGGLGGWLGGSSQPVAAVSANANSIGSGVATNNSIATGQTAAQPNQSSAANLYK